MICPFFIYMPYNNLHTFRIRNPEQFDSFRTVKDKFGDGIDVLFGIKDGKSVVASIRFDSGKFSYTSAKQWLKDHDYNPIESSEAIHKYKRCSLCYRVANKRVVRSDGNIMPVCDECLPGMIGEIEDSKENAFVIQMPKSDVKEKVSKRDYHSVQLDFPKDISGVMKGMAEQIDPVDITDDDPIDPHVTVKFGLNHDVNLQDVRDIVEGFGAIDVEFGDVASFGVDETQSDFEVIKVDVNGDKLRELNNKLSELPNSDKHPEYKPHATLAYVKPGTAQKYLSIHNPLKGRKVTLDKAKLSKVDFSDEYIDLSKSGPPNYRVATDSRHNCSTCINYSYVTEKALDTETDGSGAELSSNMMSQGQCKIYSVATDEHHICDEWEQAMNKRAISSDLPLAPEDKEWDSTSSESRVRGLIGIKDTSDLEDSSKRSRYEKRFFYVDGDGKKFGDYKLPFADVVDGSLKAVWRGVVAAYAATQGSRGGVNIKDSSSVLSKIKHYYDKFDKPWPMSDMKKTCVFKQVNEEERTVEGIVMVPDKEDLQGDIASGSDIRKAVHKFMFKYQEVNIMHSKSYEDLAKGLVIVGCTTLPNAVDYFGDGNVLPANTWILKVYIGNDDTWELVKTGKLRGFSIEGTGKRTPA